MSSGLGGIGMQSSIVRNRNIAQAKRWDFEYFDPAYREGIELLRASKWPISPLGEVVSSLTDGQHGYLVHLSSGIPLLRTSNVFENEIRLDDVRYIAPEVHAEIKRSQLRPGDVLLTTIGSIGIAAVVDETLGEANINQNLVKMTPNPQVHPWYLALFLNSRFGRIQTERTASKSVVPIVNYARLREALVPVPPRPVQDRIAQVMQDAYAVRRTKLAEAQELLNGIDKFVFGLLGIAPDQARDATRFLRPVSEMRGKRFDVTFNMGFDKLRSYIEHVMPIGDVAHLATETSDPSQKPKQTFKYIDIASIDTEIGQIREVQEIQGADAPSRARQVVHAGDVIVSTVRPTRGAIAVVPREMDGFICSTGFSILRPRNLVTPEYLHIALRLTTTLEQFDRRSSGSSYPAILNSDILETRIPIPDRPTQDTIAAEIASRWGKVQQLRAEAEQSITQAKTHVERMILGEESVP